MQGGLLQGSPRQVGSNLFRVVLAGNPAAREPIARKPTASIKGAYCKETYCKGGLLQGGLPQECLLQVAASNLLRAVLAGGPAARRCTGRVPTVSCKGAYYKVAYCTGAYCKAASPHCEEQFILIPPLISVLYQFRISFISVLFQFYTSFVSVLY